MIETGHFAELDSILRLISRQYQSVLICVSWFLLIEAV